MQDPRNKANNKNLHGGQPCIRWVNIEWAEYILVEDQILVRMDLFEDWAGELYEDVYPD